MINWDLIEKELNRGFTGMTANERAVFEQTKKMVQEQIAFVGRQIHALVLSCFVGVIRRARLRQKERRKHGKETNAARDQETDRCIART